MRTRLTALLLVPALVFLACGDDGDEGAAATSTTAGTDQTDETMDVTTSSVSEAPAFEESEANSKLEYRLIEFTFEGPRTAKGRNVLFTAENAGTQNHELEILDPDGEARGEIEEMPPGESGELAIRLGPGTYTLQCILETPDGRIHKDLGMVAQLVVE